MTLFAVCGPSSLCCQQGAEVVGLGGLSEDQAGLFDKGGMQIRDRGSRSGHLGGPHAGAANAIGGGLPGGHIGDFAGERRQGPPLRLRLQVPLSFSRFMAGSGGMGLEDKGTQESLLEGQKFELQDLLKQFTREMMRGVSLDVVLDDGTSVECMCKLDLELTTLSMRVAETYRSVPLGSIEKVCSLEETRGLQTANHHYLDVHCATLVLRDAQFVTFRFDSVPVREYFCTCLKVLRMAKADT